MIVFSYFYYFALYVNPSGTNICTFQLRRGTEKLEYTIRPEFRSEKTIELN